MMPHERLNSPPVQAYGWLDVGRERPVNRELLHPPSDDRMRGLDGRRRSKRRDLEPCAAHSSSIETTVIARSTARSPSRQRGAEGVVILHAGGRHRFATLAGAARPISSLHAAAPCTGRSSAGAEAWPGRQKRLQVRLRIESEIIIDPPFGNARDVGGRRPECRAQRHRHAVKLPADTITPPAPARRSGTRADVLTRQLVVSADQTPASASTPLRARSPRSGTNTDPGPGIIAAMGRRIPLP